MGMNPLILTSFPHHENFNQNPNRPLLYSHRPWEGQVQRILGTSPKSYRQERYTGFRRRSHRRT